MGPDATPAVKTYEFSGTVSSPVASGAVVHVIVQDPSPHASVKLRSGKLYPEKWLVSPVGSLASDGRWKVTWTLKDPPRNGRWVPVLVRTGEPLGNCPKPCPPYRYTNALRVDGVEAKNIVGSSFVPDGITPSPVRKH